MDKRFIAVPAALVMIALLGSSSSAMQPPSSVTRLPSHAVRAGSVPHFGHVFVLIGENTSAADVNSLHTPYIVNTLMPEGGTLTNYSALHGGSLSDYIGMTSGKFTQCDVNDDFPYNRNTGQPICVSYGPSLFHLLDKAGISWTDWNESMPNPCGFMDMGTDWAFNIYATHHNPAVYYNDVEGSRYGENYRYSPNPECLSNVLPMGSTAPNDTSTFDADLAAGTVPMFNFITPNECEDGHDLCGPGHRLTQFDAFLAREVPRIMASPAFGHDSLIIVTYDEWGAPGSKLVAFVAVGPLVAPGSVSATAYTHYSLLRTIEDGYGLHPYLGGAAHTTSITGIWSGHR